MRPAKASERRDSGGRQPSRGERNTRPRRAWTGNRQRGDDTREKRPGQHRPTFDGVQRSAVPMNDEPHQDAKTESDGSVQPRSGHSRQYCAAAHSARKRARRKPRDSSEGSAHSDAGDEHRPDQKPFGQPMQHERAAKDDGSGASSFAKRRRQGGSVNRRVDRQGGQDSRYADVRNVRAPPFEPFKPEVPGNRENQRAETDFVIEVRQQVIRCNDRNGSRSESLDDVGEPESSIAEDDEQTTRRQPKERECQREPHEQNPRNPEIRDSMGPEDRLKDLLLQLHCESFSLQQVMNRCE